MPKHICFLFSFFFSLIAFGQLKPASIFMTRHFSTSDGLSNNTGYTITQDGKGFIWIGTDEGVNRFNGVEFQHYYKDAANDKTLFWNRVYNLHTDSDGDIWIAADAVSLFNTKKETFTHWKYTDGNPPGLAYIRINSISTDHSGNIWVATYEGVNMINKASGKVSSFFPETMYTVTHSTVEYLLHNNYPAYVTSAAAMVLNHTFKNEAAIIDSLNLLFNHNEKAFYFERILEKAEQEHNPNSLLERSVKFIDTDPTGRIWFAYHQRGVSSYDPSSGTFRHYPDAVDSGKATGDLINSLVFTENKVWMGTTQEGLKVLDVESGETSKITTDGESYISHLRLDNNEIWIADNSGVLIYNIVSDTYNRIRLLHPDYGILPNMITRCTFQDKQGNIWVGTANKGVFLLKTKNNFIYFEHHLRGIWEDTDYIVTSITQDKESNFWIGYANGRVDIINPEGIFKNTLHRPKYYETLMLDIFTIFRDDEDNMWISSYEGGVEKYDSRGNFIKSWRQSQGTDIQIKGNDIRSIAQDSSGKLYFGIHGKGIAILDQKTGYIKHLTNDPANPSESLASNWIYWIMVDKQDNLWVSSVLGLTKYATSTGTFNHFNFGQEESSLSIAHTFTIDSKGLIWVGTEFGLVLFNPLNHSFLRLTNEHGLSSNLISALVEDSNNNLWISTPNGIDFLDLNGLDLHKEQNFCSDNSELFANRIRSFNREDGLLSDNFTKNAFYKSNTGMLFFGSSHGVAGFNPDSIHIHTLTPPVYITGLSLFNKEVTGHDDTGILKQSLIASESIKLKHFQNVITFKYVSPNFTGTSKIRYAYKLEGFDENWNYVGNQRLATYTNLGPGTYSFRVKATNSDGIWLAEPASLQVIVLPPWWKTTPAIMIYFFMLLGLFYALRIIWTIKTKARLEIEKMQELDALKTRFFTNISHEIRTPLTLIAGPIKKLIREKEQFNWTSDFQLINLMYRNLLRLQTLVNQYLDYRKIDTDSFHLSVRKGDIVLYINEIKEAFEYVAIEKNIKLSLLAEQHSINAWFDPELIEKVTFNLLSNAFKFTPAKGSIDIRIERIKHSATPLAKAYADEYIAVSIKDTGPGIPENLREKIFDRYYQIQDGAKVRVKGTGIGLSLAKDLMELHKGVLKTYPANPSSYQDGSVFVFYIPYGKEYYEENIAPDTKDLPIKKRMMDLPMTFKTDGVLQDDSIPTTKQEDLPLILIIEDNPDVRQYLKHELRASYRILETATAEEGYEIARNEMPDLIVSDIMLPGMDGDELCKKIKSEVQTDHIPVILLTARFGDHEKISGLSSGADVYLTKPFIPEELMVSIKNLIESRKKMIEKFNLDFSSKPLNIIQQCAKDKFLEKALAIIEDNLSNTELDVDFMTLQMGISRAQLYRKFSAVTNQTVKGFVKLVRLKKAAELLATGDLNVSEVAYSVGFSDLTYFTRCFKAQYKMTPSKYASQHGLKEKA
ncbi:MAG: hybrid sensor histidine kinase/response regulator [Bacteroidetes bacterium]|nr:MAG: hybrid sensor histidine kinase/response regulator [Bacteroidota bacterium]